MTSTRVRVAALTSALALAAVALVSLPAVSLTPAQPAAADNPCLTGYGAYPNLNVGTLSPVDSDVSAYIGGDFTTLAGSSEAEGLIVVGDDATFTTPYFNVGVAGIGSRVSPLPMSDMLVTGGDVFVDTSVDATSTVEVGNAIGGDVVSGGTVSPLTAVQTNGGSITQAAPSPLAPYASTPTFYQALSAEYLALTNTGTVSTADSWQVVFTGDGTSSRQVFTVDGSDLGAAPTTKSMVFLGIPVDAVVIVNVTGTAPVVWANSFFLNNTVTPINPVADFAVDPTFSNFTQSLMWNFPSATSLLLGSGDQLLGSMMVPNAAATTTLLTSTNGRLYIGGNLVMGGSTQTGLEIHNYAFRFATSCGAVGELSITKSLSDPDSIVDPRSYTGTYECFVGATSVASGTWSLTAGGTAQVVSGIPEDAECSVTEDALTTNPSATDDTYAWNAPVYSPATVTIIADDSSAIEVQNSVTHDVGSITIVKALSDPDAVVTTNILYTGTYECVDAVDAVVASGIWQLSAGGSVVISPIPADAECTIDEDPLTVSPSVTDSSYVWGVPTFTPASQVVVIDETRTLTVNNSIRRGLGDLELIKVLDDPFDVVDLSRVYTGTFQCTHLASTIAQGSWSTTAGAPALVLATDLPAGTQCTAAEDVATLAAPPLAGYPQYIWREPVISPALITIADGVTSRITVTNIVYDPFGLLAATGSETAAPLLFGGGALAAGLIVMLVAYRRRVL